MEQIRAPHVLRGTINADGAPSLLIEVAASLFLLFFLVSHVVEREADQEKEKKATGRCTVTFTDVLGCLATRLVGIPTYALYGTQGHTERRVIIEIKMGKKENGKTQELKAVFVRLLACICARVVPKYSIIHTHTSSPTKKK